MIKKLIAVFCIAGIVLVFLNVQPACAVKTKILPGGDKALTEEDKTALLKIARDTLELYLNKQIVPSLKNYTISMNLQKHYGAFVTLKKKISGELRGCIGYIRSPKPLTETVVDCVVQAATRDRRFPSMKKGEAQSVHIEISVLTSPERIINVNKIEIGRHGLIISKGRQTGILLPQVPVEQGWNRNEFLKAICTKAGLPEKSWEKGALLYVFSAQIFGENY